jgi:hypothetical protein
MDYNSGEMASLTRRQIHILFDCKGAGIRGINSTRNPNWMVLIMNADPQNYRDTVTDVRIEPRRIYYVGVGSIKMGDQKMNGDNRTLRDFRGIIWVYNKYAKNDYRLYGQFSRVGDAHDVINDGRHVFLFPLVEHLAQLN